MDGNQNRGVCDLILTIDGHCIILILKNAGGSETDGVILDQDVWDMIAPIALSESPALMAEFESVDFEPDETKAISVEVDEHVLSLFWLAIIVECQGFSPVVAQIADCWMHIPLSHRSGWKQEANSDKPIHAQILATKCPPSPVFSNEVPSWLPRLIDAGTAGSLMFTSDGLHWTYANSPLGQSCIAFLDDESDDHDACLAFSDCPVSCGAADGSMQGEAVKAIDQLIAFRDMVEADSAVARRVGWEVSGHELIAMAATLQEWRDRLQGPEPDHT
jgi:hypothetical protein